MSFLPLMPGGSEDAIIYGDFTQKFVPNRFC